jgi:hypothetical protein
MMELAQHQQWLQTAITQMPTPTQIDTTTQLASDYLQSTDNLAASQRLHIYQSSYRARILQSFHAIFPGLRMLLGTELLDAFVLDFLAHRAPRHFSINRIADGFIAHLENTRPNAVANGDGIDLLIDVARLEYHLLEISEAEGLENVSSVSSVEIAALTNASDAQLLQYRPQIAPCARLLHCRYPVHHYLNQVQQGQSDTDVKAVEAVEAPAAREVYLGLTRLNYRLATRELAAPQWHFLRLCNEQNTVTQALQEMRQLALFPRADVDLVRLWLGNFLNQGLLASLTCQQE